MPFKVVGGEKTGGSVLWGRCRDASGPGQGYKGPRGGETEGQMSGGKREWES